MFEVCTGVKKWKTSYHTCLSDGWITPPHPSNVICDLLFYNKLPYHVILTGRSNHACKEQSNYSPLLSKKPSSIPMSSLYTMKGHKSIVNFLPAILDFCSHEISSEQFCCFQQMHFYFLELVIKLFLMRNRYWLIGFESICIFKKRERYRIRRVPNWFKQGEGP